MDQITDQVSIPQPALKPLSLRANFTWTLIGNVVYAGCSWVMLVVLAKLGTPEMVGRFALGLAVTSPVIMFACLQLRAIQATDARREYLFRDYFGLRLIMLGAALVVISGIVLVSSYDLELALTILVIGLGKAVDAISDVIYGALQQQEKMDRISVSLVWKGILSLALLAGGLVLTHSVLWASVGWTLASVIVVIGYDLKSGLIAVRPRENDRFRPRFNPRLLINLTWLALPLGLVQMLISLNANLPRYFIMQFRGAYELGIFSAIDYVEGATGVIGSALGDAASPRLAQHHASGNSSAFRQLLFKLIVIGILFGAAGIIVSLIAGRQLLALFYSAEYARQDILVRVMVSVAFTHVGWYLGRALTASRHFRAQLPLFLTITAIAVVAYAGLVPNDGLRGAANSLVVVAVAQVILSSLALYVLRSFRLHGESQ